MAHNMGRKRLKAQIEALKESAISKKCIVLTTATKPLHRQYIRFSPLALDSSIPIMPAMIMLVSRKPFPPRNIHLSTSFSCLLENKRTKIKPNHIIRTTIPLSIKISIVFTIYASLQLISSNVNAA